MRTVVVALLLAGCIDEFHGSNVQVDFSPAMPVQASPAAMTLAADELPADVHFTLYAFQDAVDASGAPVGHLFELQKFEIHRVVDLRSPCFIDVGSQVPFEGLHVTQFATKMAQDRGIDDVSNPPPGASDEDLIDVLTARQRMANVLALASDQGPKVVSSVSTGHYLDVAGDCTGAGIPPATCTDKASNDRRLELCQRAWDDDPDYFEGTDRILTAPLNGVANGMVTGINPVNLAPVGGAQFFVDEGLEAFDGFAIYWQMDGAAASDLGTLLLFGRPESATTRGVIRVPLRSLISPLVTAELAIFANLDDDEVHF